MRGSNCECEKKNIVCKQKFLCKAYKLASHFCLKLCISLWLRQVFFSGCNCFIFPTSCLSSTRSSPIVLLIHGFLIFLQVKELDDGNKQSLQQNPSLWFCYVDTFQQMQSISFLLVHTFSFLQATSLSFITTSLSFFLTMFLSNTNSLSFCNKFFLSCLDYFCSLSLKIILFFNNHFISFVYFQSLCVVRFFLLLFLFSFLQYFFQKTSFSQELYKISFIFKKNSYKFFLLQIFKKISPTSFLPPPPSPL